MPTIERIWRATGSFKTLLAATDPEKCPELHPLIRSVSNIKTEGNTVEWDIQEQVPFGPFWIPNHYHARRTVLSDHRLSMEAWSIPSLYLLHTLDCSIRMEGLEVRHQVQIDAPFYVRSFVVSTAQKAHDEWIARVQDWMAKQG